MSAWNGFLKVREFAIERPDKIGYFLTEARATIIENNLDFELPSVGSAQRPQTFAELIDGFDPAHQAQVMMSVLGLQKGLASEARPAAAAAVAAVVANIVAAVNAIAAVNASVGVNVTAAANAGAAVNAAVAVNVTVSSSGDDKKNFSAAEQRVPILLSRSFMESRLHAELNEMRLSPFRQQALFSRMLLPFGEVDEGEEVSSEYSFRGRDVSISAQRLQAGFEVRDGNIC